MESEGFTTGAGVYKTTYHTTGLAFETPEAFYENKKYRSIGYMRPLSIWAINRALTPSWLKESSNLKKNYSYELL